MSAVFDPYWPPAANPIVPTSSGFYPYTAEEMWSGVAKKSACGPCQDTRSLQGLGACCDACAISGGSCAKNGSMLAGLALGGIGAAGDGERGFTSGQRFALVALGMLGIGLSSYHGYARTGSVGSAIAWGFFGALAPLITVPVAFAQGFGEPA